MKKKYTAFVLHVSLVLAFLICVLFLIVYATDYIQNIDDITNMSLQQSSIVLVVLMVVFAYFNYLFWVIDKRQDYLESELDQLKKSLSENQEKND